MRLLRVAAIVCLIAPVLTALGCKVSGLADNRTVIFTGTIAAGGTGPLHTFRVTKNGEYEMRITALSQSLAVGMTFGVQTPDGGCSPLLETAATLNQLAAAGPLYSGEYCLLLYDLFTVVTAPGATYTVTALLP
jgi:hypothetical protein